MYLVVSIAFPPEPIVSSMMARDIARELANRGKVRVVTPVLTRPKGFDFKSVVQEDELYEHVILKSYTNPPSRMIGRMVESISFGLHVSRYLKRNHEAVRCLYIYAWPLFAQFFIARKAKQYGIPSVTHVQDIYPESLTNKLPVFGGLAQRLLLPIDKAALKDTDRIIAISDNMRMQLRETRNIQEDKIETIEIWHNEEEYIEYQQIQSKPDAVNGENRMFTFMYLGNIGAVAGVEFLIECFHKANLRQAQLIIAGSGSQMEKCKEISNSLLNPDIIFWDVPYGKVPEIQDRADVMLLPVRKGAALSSIPSKLAAYMFSAKPVVACVDDSSDTASAITNSKCGWVLPAEDENALILQMKKCESVQKPDLLTIGKNGFNYAMEHFSRKTNVNRVVSILEEISRY